MKKRHYSWMRILSPDNVFTGYERMNEFQTCSINSPSAFPWALQIGAKTFSPSEWYDRQMLAAADRSGLPLASRLPRSFCYAAVSISTSAVQFSTHNLLHTETSQWLVRSTDFCWWQRKTCVLAHIVQQILQLRQKIMHCLRLFLFCERATDSSSCVVQQATNTV